jgi:hypothetical protein
MNALLKIRDAGFQIDMDGGDLLIAPGEKLTDNQLAFLRNHKAEIIQALQQEQAANDTPTPAPVPVDDDRHFCHECRNLINGRCVASMTRYSPVDDIPRRCGDYSPVT